jgi:hypothetical protein
MHFVWATIFGFTPCVCSFTVNPLAGFLLLPLPLVAPVAVAGLTLALLLEEEGVRITCEKPLLVVDASEDDVIVLDELLDWDDIVNVRYEYATFCACAFARSAVMTKVHRTNIAQDAVTLILFIKHRGMGGDGVAPEDARPSRFLRRCSCLMYTNEF